MPPGDETPHVAAFSVLSDGFSQVARRIEYAHPPARLALAAGRALSEPERMHFTNSTPVAAKVTPLAAFLPSGRRVAALLLVLCSAPAALAQNDDKTLRVFIFAGQSNMVGSDSKAKDIQRFPPFAGLDQPQENVKFSYNLGREDKRTSKGWTSLQPVDGVVGPELSFARMVAQNVKAPLAILKVAAGGTHLGGDWNPDHPTGFKLYPLALDWVKTALADLKRAKIAYRLEGFMWHQGENDMFEPKFREAYADNLKNFMARWRRDLAAPDLRFYVGQLCTKTIWGMDHRKEMYAIEVAQRAVTDADPLADFVPTSHVGVEIGGGEGLHYHYGTLGQLEHGVNYADAYLRAISKERKPSRPLKPWPYPNGCAVKLYVLAGHRNMEGERAFVQDLKALPAKAALLRDDPRIAFRYDLGGGFKVSDGWEPLGPAGPYDTFGPELSFAAAFAKKSPDRIAIAKFTDSGSQIVDWTPEGSEAKGRNRHAAFVSFVREAQKDLKSRGHPVALAGVLYHLGENDLSFGPYRNAAAARLGDLVAGTRRDLGLPDLKWIVSRQPPADGGPDAAAKLDAALAKLGAADPHLVVLPPFVPSGQPEKIVLTTPGVVALGEALAEAVQKRR